MSATDHAASKSSPPPPTPFHSTAAGPDAGRNSPRRSTVTTRSGQATAFDQRPPSPDRPGFDRKRGESNLRQPDLEVPGRIGVGSELAGFSRAWAAGLSSEAESKTEERRGDEDEGEAEEKRRRWIRAVFGSPTWIYNCFLFVLHSVSNMVVHVLEPAMQEETTG